MSSKSAQEVSMTDLPKSNQSYAKMASKPVVAATQFTARKPPVVQPLTVSFGPALPVRPMASLIRRAPPAVPRQQWQQKLKAKDGRPPVKGLS